MQSLKKILIIVTFLFLMSSGILGQEENTIRLSYESIKKIIEDDNISFEEKYYLKYNHLSSEERISILNMLTPLAKLEEDKGKLISVYCDLYQTHKILNGGAINENYTYLDSAYTYINCI